MAFSIFIAGMLLVLVALGYDSWQGRRLRARDSHTFSAYDATVKQLQNKERGLQDELDELKNKLKNTFVDPVTNLLGWQLFQDRVHQAIKDSERHQLSMGLMMIDLDDFKKINDALSYEIGDLLLREVASRLKECVREVDNISRFTKDTFVVLLTQLAKPETAVIVAQRILQTIALPFQIGDIEINLTSCIGVALFPIDAKDAQTLLAHADHALHLAKLQGNQLCQFYEESMQLQSIRDLHLSNGVSKEEYFQAFSWHFQPIFDVKTNKMFCLEASIYWQHSDFGVVTQKELFYYAEKQRKMNALSVWMVKQACEQFMQLMRNGLQPEFLALPISIKQLENAHFIYEISQVMQSLQFPPDKLIIQLREHATDISFDILQKAFNMLHYLNVKIAIDHFGARSVNLRYLKAMQVNFLKLDSIFIDDLLENPNTQTLISATGHFAEELSMQLIITGILEKAQVDLLLAKGCRLMQGDWLCASLSLEDLQKKFQPEIA